jgi:hypothetical protein
MKVKGKAKIARNEQLIAVSGKHYQSNHSIYSVIGIPNVIVCHHLSLLYKI